MLHDQSDHLGFYSNPSDDYDGQDVLDNQSADDFTVPPGQRWQLTSLDLIGADVGAASRLVNAWIYGTAGTLPGAQLFQDLGVSAGNYPNYSVPLAGAPALDGSRDVLDLGPADPCVLRDHHLGLADPHCPGWELGRLPQSRRWLCVRQLPRLDASEDLLPIGRQ